MKKTIISVSELSEIIHQANLVLLDASPINNKSGLTSAFSDQQIKGTRKIDLVSNFSNTSAPFPNPLLSEADFQKAAQNLGINKDSFIVVYDNLGIYTSPRVWWMFQVMGHENIVVLDGGLPTWIAAGHATESIVVNKYGLGNFEANFSLEKVVGFKQVLDNLTTQECLVIDARSKGRFDGTAAEPREGLSSGHMPHSKNLPFLGVLENGKYKSKEELQQIFYVLDATRQPLVFSCGSGLTACIILLASEIAGIKDSRLYDGSWTEWAQKEGAEIEKQ